jgi:hypothetical protein
MGDGTGEMGVSSSVLWAQSSFEELQTCPAWFQDGHFRTEDDVPIDQAEPSLAPKRKNVGSSRDSARSSATTRSGLRSGRSSGESQNTSKQSTPVVVPSSPPTDVSHTWMVEHSSTSASSLFAFQFGVNDDPNDGWERMGSDTYAGSREVRLNIAPPWDPCSWESQMPPSAFGAWMSGSWHSSGLEGHLTHATWATPSCIPCSEAIERQPQKVPVPSIGTSTFGLDLRQLIDGQDKGRADGSAGFR